VTDGIRVRTKPSSVMSDLADGRDLSALTDWVDRVLVSDVLPPSDEQIQATVWLPLVIAIHA
jgi:hypothetical protein